MYKIEGGGGPKNRSLGIYRNIIIIYFLLFKVRLRQILGRALRLCQAMGLKSYTRTDPTPSPTSLSESGRSAQLFYVHFFTKRGGGPEIFLYDWGRYAFHQNQTNGENNLRPLSGI